MAQEQNKNQKLTLKLFIAAILMFGFGFAMVPLYDVFCDITGLNGKTGDQVYVDEGDEQVVADKQREITVQFLSVNNESASIRFKPAQSSVKVHPGDVTEILYTATNLTDYEMVTQSVPSVQPLGAAEYMKKIECFCFENQSIAVGETKEMPLRFYIDKNLPETINKLSLNYTIFDITEPKAVDQLAQQEHGDHMSHH